MQLAIFLLLACTPDAVVGAPDLPSETGEPDLTDTSPVLPGDTGETGTVAPPESGCTVTPTRVVCPHQTLVVQAGREVHYQLPIGTPPAGGWPTVLLFQGSFNSAILFFEGEEGDPFGGLHQARLVDALLSHGYAVVAPEAHLDGGLFWDTNILPWSLSWSGAPDDLLMKRIFTAISGGELGDLDDSHLYATGISSGGYMTSRMAVSYPGRFRALAIQSASYATCSGPLCVVPSMPANHPPTLFLHGTNDLIVPLYTTTPYRDKLDAAGFIEDIVLDADAGHEWLEASPDAIVDWFARYHEG